MKYLNKSFSVGMFSKEYAEGWERIFGKKEEETKLAEDLKMVEDTVQLGKVLFEGEK